MLGPICPRSLWEIVHPNAEMHGFGCLAENQRSPMVHLVLKSLALKVHILEECLIVNGEIQASLKTFQMAIFI